jgi:uncharacterized protein YaiI (UPF0178 family)
MKIIVDADACPRGVKKICEDLSLEYRLDLLMIIDDSHELQGNYRVIQVEKGQDSVDHEIVRNAEKDDIVITQDYGLASILLENTYAILHPDGFRYTRFNIDQLMFQRHMGNKIRQAGGRTKGPKKRKADSDKKFREALLDLLVKCGYRV